MLITRRDWLSSSLGTAFLAVGFLYRLAAAQNGLAVRV
jgi:hypothetical protein